MKKGFTLAEVLISLGIILASLLVLYTVLAQTQVLHKSTNNSADTYQNVITLSENIKQSYFQNKIVSVQDNNGEIILQKDDGTNIRFYNDGEHVKEENGTKKKTYPRIQLQYEKTKKTVTLTYDKKVFSFLLQK